jgi:hypothetical protein
MSGTNGSWQSKTKGTTSTTAITKVTTRETLTKTRTQVTLGRHIKIRARRTNQQLATMLSHVGSAIKRSYTN